MADQKTSMDWGAVAVAKREEAAIAAQKEKEIQAQIAPIANEANQLRSQNAKDNQTINGALGRYIDKRGGVSGVQSTDPNADNYVDPAALEKYNTAKGRIDANTAREQELNQQLAPLSAARGDAASMRVAAEAEAKNADNQKAEAEKGPTDTKTNTPPVVDPSTEQKAAADAKATSEADANAKSADGTTPIAPSSDPAAARAQLQAEEKAGGITGADAGSSTTQSADATVSPTSASTKTASGSATESKQQASQLASPFIPANDWRVRISLAPGATYLYKAKPAGILAPLAATEGVIFPYTPSISLIYAASYEPIDLVHSNYKSYNYKNSSVDQITITADFTAQYTAEANYLLAVIHFFRSAAKMFYGQDNDPPNGTPPPLLYLSGYGAYQFDNHPMVLTSFSYTLPTDVDYISASITTDAAGTNTLAPLNPATQAAGGDKPKNFIDKFKDSLNRLTGSGLQPGAKPSAPVFTSSATINDATRVPTKIQLQLTFLPIVTRDAISNSFSFKQYATGQLLRGSKNANTGGGIW